MSPALGGGQRGSSADVLRDQKLVLVTHVQFWDVQSGKESRLSELIAALRERGVQLHLVHTEHLSKEERSAVRAAGFQSIVSVAPWKRGFYRRLRERLSKRTAAFLKGIRGVYRWLAGVKALPPVRLDDWRSPAMLEAVAAVYRRVKPDVLLVEYVILAYVREAVGPEVVTVIDTHDVMHLRQESYQERGLPHWLNLTREEEADALSRFDVVVAIQKQEAELFREMLPGTAVVTCPPSLGGVPRGSGQETPVGGPPTLLVVGSRMEANRRGLEGFLGEAWPAVRVCFPDARFRVCGKLASYFPDGSYPGVELVGFVPDLAEEYRACDLVISPVTFGGGIKVKCLEALAHGKPCVISRHSTAGFQGGEGTAFLVADDWREFAEKTIHLLRDPELRSTVSARALDFVKDNFSRERCLDAMVQAIDEVRSRKQAGEVGTA